METYIRYYTIGDKPSGKWIVIEDTDSGMNSALLNNAKHILTLALEFVPQKEKSEPNRRGNLFIDFDCRNNPEDAIASARELIEIIKNIYSVDPHIFKIWMTGGKGCHIEIPSSVYGDLEGDPYLHLIHKKMINKIISQCISISFNKDHVDLQMYCGGKGKMARIENIQRENGRYKVPVTCDEFMTFDYDRLYELTENSRNICINSFDNSKISIEFKRLFCECQKEVYNENVLNDKRICTYIFRNLDECSFCKYCSDNQDKVTEPMWMAFLSIFPKNKFGFDAALERSKNYLGFNMNEFKRKFDHSKQYHYGCVNIHTSFPTVCEGKCGVKSPRELLLGSNESVHQCEMRNDGLYIFEKGKVKKICDRFEIIARCSNAGGDEHGKIVKFRN